MVLTAWQQALPWLGDGSTVSRLLAYAGVIRMGNTILVEVVSAEVSVECMLQSASHCKS